MNGIAVPLFFVAPDEVNIQIPWELAGQTQASLTVTDSNGTSNAVSVNLVAFAPAIITLNSAGTGPGAITKPDHSYIGANNPATPSSTVQINASGLGAVSNQPSDGLSPSLNTHSNTTTVPSVSIGGISATVLSSELCPSDYQ